MALLNKRYALLDSTFLLATFYHAWLYLTLLTDFATLYYDSTLLHSIIALLDSALHSTMVLYFTLPHSTMNLASYFYTNKLSMTLLYYTLLYYVLQLLNLNLLYSATFYDFECVSHLCGSYKV